MIKRLFDLIGAGLGIVLLLPLLIVIGLWIKSDTSGPVLFRQQRVGRYGAPFKIHKFRTMRHTANEQGTQLTVGADPRITRAGRFLRRTKLDELPQLWDVLVGHMSLVGPRPEVPRYVAMYPSDLRDKVLSVRPGITDPASIEYRAESELLAAASDPERTYVDIVMPAKLRYAAQYVDERSMWMDLRLIVATIHWLWSDRAPTNSTESTLKR